MSAPSMHRYCLLEFNSRSPVIGRDKLRRDVAELEASLSDARDRFDEHILKLQRKSSNYSFCIRSMSAITAGLIETGQEQHFDAWLELRGNMQDRFRELLVQTENQIADDMEEFDLQQTEIIEEILDVKAVIRLLEVLIRHGAVDGTVTRLEDAELEPLVGEEAEAEAEEGGERAAKVGGQLSEESGGAIGQDQR